MPNPKTLELNAAQAKRLINSIRHSGHWACVHTLLLAGIFTYTAYATWAYAPWWALTLYVLGALLFAYQFVITVRELGALGALAQQVERLIAR